MKLFSVFYEKVMGWSRHRHAPAYLAGLSFAESSFFPIPPDVMLAPMSMASPSRAVWYASLTTLASVLGGVLGYLIGLLAFEAVAPTIKQMGYWDKYLTAREWFDTWGFWAVFLAGFSPIPYKIFTITAGVAVLNFPGFVIASLVGRGARFFLVAGLVVAGGERMEALIPRYVERLGWAVVVVTVVAVGYLMQSG